MSCVVQWNILTGIFGSARSHEVRTVHSALRLCLLSSKCFSGRPRRLNRVCEHAGRLGHASVALEHLLITHTCFLLCCGVPQARAEAMSAVVRDLKEKVEKIMQGEPTNTSIDSMYLANALERTHTHSLTHTHRQYSGSTGYYTRTSMSVSKYVVACLMRMAVSLTCRF